MLIGRVSELTGATRKAIRHYETIGLIPIPQRKGTYRSYVANDIVVIKMIRRAQTLGFSLNELKEIVASKTSKGEFPISLACDLIDKKILDLKQEMEKIRLKEENLQKLKGELVKQFT